MSQEKIFRDIDQTRARTEAKVGGLVGVIAAAGLEIIRLFQRHGQFQFLEAVVVLAVGAAVGGAAGYAHGWFSGRDERTHYAQARLEAIGHEQDRVSSLS